MKTNQELKTDVLDAIRWEPMLSQAKIGVETLNGLVTLSGTVDSYVKKSQAEETVKKVSGVTIIVEKIAVKFANDPKITDEAIALAVQQALKWNWDIPINKLQAEVEDGHVTLEGEVQWKHQKDAAQNAVAKVGGIKMLSNHIRIKAETADDVEQKDIEQAIARNWAMNDQEILVAVVTNKVTLSGIAHSFYQKEEAERMAWNAPGVWSVENEIIIE
jgi:osmotically-inducible protein OsmY